MRPSDQKPPPSQNVKGPALEAVLLQLLLLMGRQEKVSREQLQDVFEKAHDSVVMKGVTVTEAQESVMSYIKEMGVFVDGQLDT